MVGWKTTRLNYPTAYKVLRIKVAPPQPAKAK